MKQKQSSYSPGTFNKSTVIVGSARPKPPRFVIQRRHIGGVILLVLAVMAFSIFGCEPAYKGTLVVGVPRPLILAKEGVIEDDAFTRLHAIDRALQVGLDGADMVAQLTAAGELVVLQDGAAIGTFEQLVRSVKGRGILLVQLQPSPASSTGIEQQAVKILRKYDAHLTVVLSSFNPLVLRRIKQMDPLIRTAFIFTDHRPTDMVGPPWALRQEFIRRGIRKFVQVDMLSINHQVDEQVIDGLIAKGWPSFIWGPESKADIRAALAKSPYGVISTNPIVARQLRGD
jgi:glycerophosphoryl diester phosphodiesterase